MYVPGLFEDPAEARQKALAQAQTFTQSLPAQQPPPGLLDQAKGAYDAFNLGMERLRGRLDPTSVGQAMLTGSLPGAGFVQAWDDFGQGRDSAKQGNYGQAAIDYGRGTLNTVLEATPLGLALPAIPGRAPTAGLLDEPVQLSGALRPQNAPVRGNTARELALMQQAQLSPRDLETLQQINAGNPAFARAAKFMMPGELSAIISNPASVDTVTRLFGTLPSAAEMASLAKAGAPKQGWYRGSTQALVDVFGAQDAPRFASLLAATSPQTSVEMNLMNSLNIWKNWTAAGRPTDPATIKAIMGQSVAGLKGEDSVLGAWINNTTRALTAEDPLKVVLSGPKVDSFYRNLADDVYRFTNDAWMANGTGISQDILRVSPTEKQLAAGNPGYSPGYVALAARGREAGQRANMLPSEAQETIWSVVMPMMEEASRRGISSRDVLQGGFLTPEVIRGTPDFSTLLRQPQYGDILRQAGYGTQVDNLQPFQFPKQLPELNAADQRNLMHTAERLDNLRDLRGREKRAMTQGFTPRADKVLAVQAFEGVPGRGTGHQENMIDAPLGQRENYTSRVLKPFQNDQGQDIINSSLFPNQTIATRPTTGAFRPTPDAPLEVNPGRAAGVELPVRYSKKGEPSLRPYDEQKMRFSGTLKGSMTAQHAVPYNAQIADDAGANLVVPREKKVEPERMLGLLDKYDTDRIAAVDTGAGVNVLNWGDRFANDQAEQIAGLLDAPKYSRTREVSSPDMNYPDLSGKWTAGEGSRQVTENLVAEMGKLKPSDLRRVDNDELRRAADGILKTYEGGAKKGEAVRGDLMNMLSIIRDGGLQGLKKALDDPSQLLPALAAVGLGPLVLQAASRTSQREEN